MEVRVEMAKLGQIMNPRMQALAASGVFVFCKKNIKHFLEKPRMQAQAASGVFSNKCLFS